MKIVLLALLAISLVLSMDRDHSQRLVKLKSMLQKTQRKMHSLRQRKANLAGKKAGKKGKKDSHKKLKKRKEGVIVSGPSKFQVKDCIVSSHSEGFDCLDGLKSETSLIA